MLFSSLCLNSPLDGKLTTLQGPHSPGLASQAS